ncbi:uncharacterized protein LOC117790996 [Drosophila innubila]|uniref:uncharacterized protein LOC117790996 n=1 Tax=Drosophila innubila TaxID=198719 RepID=UPI00148C338C|nr:uncharacterized protein LOC117790996 [Drosophila innubila]
MSRMSSENIVRRTAILGALQPDLKPWQRIDWSLYIQSRIFRDWGQYYTHRLVNKKALQSFANALQACRGLADEASSLSFSRFGASHVPSNNWVHEAYTTFDNRSKCFRDIAQGEAAYKDSQQAQKLVEREGFYNSSIILAKCDALFDCNQFEDNLHLLHTEARKFQGQSIQHRFNQHKNRTLAVLEESLGSSLNPFLLENWPFITDSARQRRKSVAFMPRPLWQKLQEHEECDVESLVYKKKESLPPMERARRRVAESVYNHHYMGKSATDVVMLRQLRDDKNFLPPYYPESTFNMSEYSAEQYTIVRKFMKMMHARSPLYPISEQQNREKYLFGVEYQTRRDCFRILSKVRRLRRDGDIDQLTDYVENAMSTEIEHKTQRTLPWKYEFISEIYNILALAHIDKRGVPMNIDFLDLNNFGILYLLPEDRLRELSNEFGGPNIYAEIDKDDERIARINVKVGKLEERLLHSRYGIERAYLLFEIARTHFNLARFGKCTTMARKAVKEARNCRSNIWRFNSTFLICQVHAAFNRFERLKESLIRAKRLAQRLNNPKLVAYLSLCQAVNDYELDYHRKRQPEFNWRRQRKRKESISQSLLQSDTV